MILMDIGKVPGVGINPGVTYGKQKTSPHKPPLVMQQQTSSPNEYTLSISDEASALLAEFENLKEMFERGKEASEGAGEAMDDKLKCLLIAMRIMNGDKVPIKDRRFLSEKEPAMYANALLLQRQNSDPKKYKSLLKDKEDDPGAELSPKLPTLAGSSEVSEVPVEVEGGE